MFKYFFIFLFLFLFSGSAYADLGCIKLFSMDVSQCYMDLGFSLLQTVISELIGLLAVRVAVFLIYKIINK